MDLVDEQILERVTEQIRRREFAFINPQHQQYVIHNVTEGEGEMDTATQRREPNGRFAPPSDEPLLRTIWCENCSAFIEQIPRDDTPRTDRCESCDSDTVHEWDFNGGRVAPTTGGLADAPHEAGEAEAEHYTCDCGNSEFYLVVTFEGRSYTDTSSSEASELWFDSPLNDTYNLEVGTQTARCQWCDAVQPFFSVE